MTDLPSILRRLIFLLREYEGTFLIRCAAYMPLHSTVNVFHGGFAVLFAILFVELIWFSPFEQTVHLFRIHDAWIENKDLEAIEIYLNNFLFCRVAGLFHCVFSLASSRFNTRAFPSCITTRI